MATKTTEEQLELIDLTPENAKPLRRAARAYKKAQGERIAALNDEKKHKEKILELVKEAKLKPLEGGVIRFSLNGMVITVTPRDQLVQVKAKDDEAEEE